MHRIELVMLVSSWHTIGIGQGQTFQGSYQILAWRLAPIIPAYCNLYFLCLAITNSFVSLAILLSRVRGLRYKKQQQRIDDILSTEL